MSQNYTNQDPLAIAHQAERDLNSHAAKHGISTADSGNLPILPFPHPAPRTPNKKPTNQLTHEKATESGIDTNATARFPGSSVKVGSAASGREIPVDEGGELISKAGEKGGSGHPTKAKDFEGPGGPETKQAIYEAVNPGNDDVRSNVR
ncbi:hypothetical protein MMC28_007915 [Mycoblastus sanguinarius]|nr:hypothetical protein [Mycoblastus sanguinarius]